ncbi:unnamed protein product [Cuscuta europaea]|uniref:Transposase n=1 Tax=Cuscuta europaea TaxID=41803 RepID=A0A9P0YXZ8_CUSEU|nr:unnamed protein product [Cuscuta europaea]
MTSHPRFEPMFNCVHVDEKWFYMTQVSPRYYLAPGEEEPYRSCKSKRYITKVMFLCVVAGPRFSPSEVLFDGKIGIFPFTEFCSAKRNIKNRAQGTIEEKAIDNVTKEVYRECLLRKVLPAIKAKWPIDASGHIFIQQDNTKPHIQPNDSEFMAAATTEGFNIKLACQPPNSPDLNILDLGFFRSVECLQQANRSSTVSELVVAVTKAYDEFSPYTLNKVWLSLQLCMTEILIVKGNNNYKIPHIGHDNLHAQGELPISIGADPTLVREVMELLANGSTQA